ncbi:MAG: hypothetical protein B6244_07800 [Candidatus Cloacimonetes bacterium 4572_55]|nr:MAG: hypothetical protein B6244_07800 [Candidatus Cloacimonetes bacterium 4572_55]
MNNLFYSRRTILFFIILCVLFLSEFARSVQSAADSRSRIVLLKSQVHIAALKSGHDHYDISRQRRHQETVEALQNCALASQPDLIPFLDKRQREGRIQSYDPIWIINGFLVVADTSVYAELRAHPAVSAIYPDSEVSLIFSTESDSCAPESRSVEPGLEQIRVPLLWQDQITGRGRIVCHIDAGVDWQHPALMSKWRGLNGGTTDASWFDPAFHTEYPTEPGIANGHGTHTMGILCGCDSATGDTVGVAVGAQWISAGNFFHATGSTGQVSDCILSFQWAIDPDGDPETVRDAPDVISNSWGFSEESDDSFDACSHFFNDVIDAVETAGTVVIFAAGNRGANGLTFPANRADSETSCFAVGALTTTGGTTATMSSRGPSQCDASDSLRIKPEVSARGIFVRSCVPGGGYDEKSGTSQAAPYVAGVVALLRQINPDATVDEIKQTLLDSAADIEQPGNDNNSGYGRVDAYAAALLMGQRITGRVVLSDSEDHSRVHITVDGVNRQSESDRDGNYRLYGLPADTLLVQASKLGYSFGSQVVILSPGHDAADIDFTLFPTGSPPNSLTAITSGVGVQIDWHAPPQFVSGYHIYRRPAYQPDFAPLIAVDYTVTSHTDSDAVPGVPYDYMATALYNFPQGESSPSDTARAVAGPLAQTPWSTDLDSDDAHFQIQLTRVGQDGGWWEWGEPTVGPGSAYSPPYLWGTDLDGSYANDSDQRLLTPFIDLSQTENPIIAFYHWYDFGSDSYTFDGGNISVSSDGGHLWRVAEPDSGYPAQEIRGLGFQPGFHGRSEQWRGCVIPLDEYAGQVIQIRFRVGTNSFLNFSGWYIDQIFIGNRNDVAVENDAQTGSDTPILRQNYPNPFNPSTIFRFFIPGDAARLPVSFHIYDVTGRMTKSLINNQLLSSGEHTICWETDSSSPRRNSGVYIYRLQIGDRFSISRKMVLLR